MISCRIRSLLRDYPLYAAVLAQTTIVEDETTASVEVTAYGRDFRMRVNPAWCRDHENMVRGAVLGEIRHVAFGHLTHPKFDDPESPALLEIAKAMSVNENLAAPVPVPIRWQDLAHIGLGPGQSTIERYELLLRAGLAQQVPPPPPRGICFGTDPAFKTEAIDDDGPPTHPIDWRSVLRDFVSRARLRTATYSQPSRRFPDRVGEIPGRRRRTAAGDHAELLVAIDTSSSMDAKTLSEIARQIRMMTTAARFTIAECDVIVHRIYPFTGRLPAVMGRGGTDFRPVFEPDILRRYAKDGVVYFTDGYGKWPDCDPGVRTLWVLTDGDARDFGCPWGARVALTHSVCSISSGSAVFP
jgi:predicted metal-dependent peptidase